jgi:hypothetical protein
VLLLLLAKHKVENGDKIDRIDRLLTLLLCRVSMWTGYNRPDRSTRSLNRRVRHGSLTITRRTFLAAGASNALVVIDGTTVWAYRYKTA